MFRISKSYILATKLQTMPLLPMYNASFIVGNLTATVEAMAMAMAFAPKHRLNCMAERP